MEDINKEKIAELINRRQRQILVHSIIYYKFDENIVSDDQWARWGMELEELQKKYPEIAEQQYYGKDFKGFDHSTGAFLPLNDPGAIRVASRLLHYYKK